MAMVAHNILDARLCHVSPKLPGDYSAYSVSSEGKTGVKVRVTVGGGAAKLKNMCLVSVSISFTKVPKDYRS